MKTNDIILRMRSTLKDINPLKYVWSDPDLIDCINFALIQLSLEDLHSVNTEFIKLEEDKSRYKLPDNYIEASSVLIENEPLFIKSLKFAQNNQNSILNLTFSVDEQSFYIFPKSKIKNNMAIEINYKYTQQIQEVTDDINLANLTKAALVFYSLHIAFMNPNSSKNAETSNRYKKLFNEQIKLIKPKISSQRNSKSIRSQYKRY